MCACVQKEREKQTIIIMNNKEKQIEREKITYLLFSKKK
jgi:hypothetical protein